MKKLVLGVAMLWLALGAQPGFGAHGAFNIALLDSEYTKEFFAAHYANCGPGIRLGENEYKRYFLGWDYVLGGQPYNGDFNTAFPALTPLPAEYAAYSAETITDGQLTEQYLTEHGVKVLILSNNVRLSDDQSRAVHGWVLKGGRLIATFGSGYKDIILDKRQLQQDPPDDPDNWKLQQGHTSGLHNLWHDPLTKAFGTEMIPGHPGVRVAITRNSPAPLPTDVFGLGIISYGAEANLLGQRPEHFRNALGFLIFDPATAWTRPQPAILLTRPGKGRVVYFAFAPEFIVALAFDLAGHCAGDTSYPVASPANAPGPVAADFPNGFVGSVDALPPTIQANTDRVRPQLQLMKRTIDFMLLP